MLNLLYVLGLETGSSRLWREELVCFFFLFLLRSLWLNPSICMDSWA